MVTLPWWDCLISGKLNRFCYSSDSPLRFMLVLCIYSHFLSLHLYRVVCTDTVVSQEPDTSAINNLLYCGYKQARCNGTSVTEEYSAAWDFSTSSLTSLSMNSWCVGCGDLRGTSSGDVAAKKRHYWSSFKAVFTQNQKGYFTSDWLTYAGFVFSFSLLNELMCWTYRYNATGNGGSNNNNGPGTLYRLPGLINTGATAWWMSVVANLTSEWWWNNVICYS